MQEKNDSRLVSVEVVFAASDRQELLEVQVPCGSSVREALDYSRIAELFPHHDFQQCTLGIWGNIVPEHRRVQQGDRVEVYRALLMDPRESRRLLAAQGRSMGPEPEDG